MSDVLIELFNFITALAVLCFIVISVLTISILLFSISLDISNHIYIIIKNFLT